LSSFFRNYIILLTLLAVLTVVIVLTLGLRWMLLAPALVHLAAGIYVLAHLGDKPNYSIRMALAVFVSGGGWVAANLIAVAFA
jgi:hypothetical protein